MDNLNFIENLGQIAGIAGIALGVFVYLFREFIRKNIFPNLGEETTYYLLRQFLYLVWSIAILSICIWGYLKLTSSPKNNITKSDILINKELDIINSNIDKGKCDDSVINSENLLKYEKEDPSIFNTIGRAYFCLKNYDMALKKFKEAFEIGRNQGYKSNRYHSNYAAALVEVGDYENAKKENKSLVDKGVGDSRYNYALALALNKELKPAYENAEIAIKENNPQGIYYFLYAMLFFEKEPKNIQDTISILKKMINVDAKSRKYICQLVSGTKYSQTFNKLILIVKEKVPTIYFENLLSSIRKIGLSNTC